MQDRMERALHPETSRNLAVLDFGVFIVGSSSHSRRQHGISVSYVPRLGPVQIEQPWTWETTACPESLAQATVLRSEAFILDAVIRLYGLQQDLPF